MLVLCVGNRFRRDDAAGLHVARRLRRRLPREVRVVEREADLASAVDDLRDHLAAVVVDAMHSGAIPGAIARMEAHDRPLPAVFPHTSSHAVGVVEAIELARALGTLPRRVIVYGIEGARFETGEGLTPAVERAVADVVDRVAEEVVRCMSWRSRKR